MSQTSIFFQDPKDLYFADESDNITIGTTDLSNPVEVRVTVGSEEIASFDLDTYNGLAVIPIGEILRSAGKRNESQGSSFIITVSQDSASVAHTARCLFCRRFGSESTALFSDWLTSGPRERTTYAGAAEMLPFLSDPEAVGQRAMIQLAFIDGTVQTRTFTSLSGRTGDGIDVSPSAVQAFARSQMLYAQIESYTLWIEYMDAQGNSRTGGSVRFNLSRDRLERVTYKFTNRKGAMEYIHASGELKRSIDTETGTFITSGVETEMTNDAKRTMEQNSGHIGGASEAEFWLDFLESRERLVRETDGTERPIVVEDSNPSVADLKVGELTFKWHYGNKNNTIINKVSIPVESIEITGDSAIDNDQNQLQLGILYNPIATTQRGVVWQLVDGAAYASISATGLLTVKEGAQGASVTIKAVSSHNGDVQAIRAFTVTYHSEPAASYGLTVTSNVDSPTITLNIDGTEVEYFDGILISEGSAVVISVSKSGYVPQTRNITFSYGETEQYFELVEDIPVTFSHPSHITAAAQDIAYTISDPQGKGWGIDFDNPNYLGYITGAAVESGNAQIRGTEITGTGDAVILLHVPANTSTSNRNIGSGTYLFYSKTSASASWRADSSLSFYQLGTSASNVPVTSVSLNKSTLSLTPGSSSPLTATVLPANATNKTVSWSSSNTSVAVVNQSGQVTAVGTGSATIRATATDGSGKYASCAVTVSPSTVSVTGVSLNKSTLTVKAGSTATLSASVSPSNATNRSVTWSTSNASVATVSQSGVVTGVAPGSATIIVTTADGGFTASCAVTVEAEDTVDPGVISVEDMVVAAAVTSGSGLISCTNIDLATLAVSENSTWITSAYIDRSGSSPRVRLGFSANNLTESRSAMVTISGVDTSGNPAQTTFTVTQRGASSSDIPCTGMAIDGVSGIANADNEAEYSCSFQPQATTQNACVWSLTDHLGNDVSDRVTLTPDGTNCKLKIIDTTATNLSVVLKATNSHNSSVYATKNITVSYMAPADYLQVNPASVIVANSATTDETPVVTLGGGATVEDIQIRTTGFIRSAYIDVSGKLVTEFAANTGTSVRTGTVTLSYLDPVTVQYTQLAAEEPVWELEITALNVAENAGMVTMRLKVNWVNTGSSSAVASSPKWSLEGLDPFGDSVFKKTGYLGDKTIAAYTEEEETYTVQWAGTLDIARSFTVTVESGLRSDTYTGNGDDNMN